jgi:hypothetical protein
MLLTLVFLALVSTIVSAQSGITLTPIGTYDSGVVWGSAAESVAYDPDTQRLFVVKANSAKIDVLDISDPSNPTKVGEIAVTDHGAAASSVTSHGGVIAVAIENQNRQAPGKVAFFDADGSSLSAVTVGALPTMLVFTPSGQRVLVANEGEPSNDYATDPEGSVSIINLSDDAASVTQDNVTTADFATFNDASLDSGIRVFGPHATVAQDLEPEYITVSPDSRTAWVALQENNALGILDVDAGQFIELVALGTKDHNTAANALDASNKDGMINIGGWPIKGMYQPDAIAAFQTGGQTYLVSANEGDARDYDGFSEETRVGDLVLDPMAFPNAAELQRDENLGRLKTTTASGDTDDDGEHEEIYAYGARSFSIWNANGGLVYDSGADLEQITAEQFPSVFNANGEHDSFDDRSDDKGPEPEGVTTGTVGGRVFAFIGLERIGGIMVYDVTDPSAPSFVQYLNTRNFDGALEEGTAGDVSPEGLTFIAANESPNGKPLLVVAYEMSGTTTVYEITQGAAASLLQTGGRLSWNLWILLLPVAAMGLLAADRVLRRWASIRN